MALLEEKTSLGKKLKINKNGIMSRIIPYFFGFFGAILRFLCFVSLGLVAINVMRILLFVNLTLRFYLINMIIYNMIKEE